MPSITYGNGVPCWVDLGTSDLEGAKAFYGALMGWEAATAGSPEESGDYTMFLKGGKTVAAVASLMQPQQPVAWVSYFYSDDIDATAARVEAAGGMTMLAPMDVMQVGRMGVFGDSAGGAAFAVWQPNEFQGAELVNEPGALVWNELHTRDMAGAKAFYEPVLGLTGHDVELGPMQYTEFRTPDDRTVAGGMAIGGDMPPQVPAHWLVYFGVPDTDAALDQVKELGGSVVMGAMDIPIGRFAVVSDPHGATFGIIALADGEPA